MTNAKAVSLAIFAAMIWGSGFIFTTVALDNGFDVYLLLFVRFLLASSVLTLVNYRQLKNITKSTLIYGTVLGIFLFLGFLFQTLGQNLSTPTTSAFLTSVSVIFVPYLCIFANKDRLSKISVISSLIAIVGIAFLTNSYNFAISSGDILLLLGAFAFALHITYLGKFVKICNSTNLMLVQMYVVTICTALTLVNDKSNLNNATALVGSFYLGVVCTALAFTIQGIVQKYLSQVKLSLLFSIESLFATFLAITILNETLTALMVVGASLIFISIVLYELVGVRK